ncbi:unnamed protein product [[Actinomadura] parvosata subsp. kistnae]|uniref:hypothetical protein n=1 Tax=[Actinomadura] parvosata TaxID=1955412 RepID=UPI000D2A0F16|nr:hypothetical protein [Nonomuraea sp. ATCC 55076]SPL94454.1 unnamed protein product [Actinomadura parvosata subsp. kistnae]
MNDVEEALRRTFARAEARIPAVPPELLREVARPPARRRGWRGPRGPRGWRGRRGLVQVVAVAAGLVLVVWGSAVVTRWVSGPPPAATPQPANTPQPAGTPQPADTSQPADTPPATATTRPTSREPATRRVVKEIAPPLEQVLPSVVAEVPRKAGNGEAFTPKTFIDERTLLGYVSKKGYDPAPEWWVYHLESRAFQRLATLDRPVAPVESPAVGEGVIVWFKYAKRNIDIMAVPVTGGTPRRVVSFEAERDVDKVNGDTVYGVDVAVGDGKVFWSSTKSGGVHQVALSGGEPSAVPGTEGLRLFRWPWAGRSADIPMGGMTELVDLSTGERLDDPAQALCDVTWCLVGGDRAMLRDGGRVVDLPGNSPRSLVADRFVTISQTDERGRKAQVIFDLATSKAGRLWMQDDHKASPTLYTDSEMLYFKRGDKWFVIHDR